MKATLIYALFALGVANAQVSDPVFSRVPFDQWTEAGQTRMRWRPEISNIGLTHHQRLMYRVGVRMDGAELVKRRGKGELLMLIELKDSEGRSYQTHGSIALADVKDDAGRSDFEYAQDAFLTPGDYRIALAIYSTVSGEYALAHRGLHVDALQRDPLPEAWRDLPSVEFPPGSDPPEAWFQPTLKGTLNLPLDTHRRVELQLVVNSTPSEETPGPRGNHMANQMMGILIPSMKTISQIKLTNGSMSASILDLARQKIIFKSSGTLIWDGLKGALTETSPHMIDVGSLEKRQGNAQFFVKEIARRVEDSQNSDALHVLIVLSAPMAFEQGEDLHPIQATAGRNCKIFYIRYTQLPTPVINPGPAMMAQRRGGANFPRTVLAVPADSLEKTLKPLNPRLFDVTSPGEFRKSLAAMMEEIEHSSR